MTADTVAYALDDLGDESVPIAFVGSLWGGILAQGPDSAGGATQLDSGEPALFLVHGDADADVPVTLSDQLAARAEQQGVPVEYHRIPGRGHGYVPSGFYDVPVDGNQTSFDRLVEATVAALA